MAVSFLIRHAVAEVPLVGDLAASLIEEVTIALESRHLNYKNANAFQDTLARSEAALRQLEDNQDHDATVHAPVAAVMPRYRELRLEIGARCAKWRTKPYWKQLRQAEQYRSEFEEFRNQLLQIIAEATLAAVAQTDANARKRAEEAKQRAEERERRAEDRAQQMEARAQQMEARLTLPASYIPEPQPLIGREEQIAALYSTLGTPRTMAALVGRGGSGKSHCAKTFARKWSDQPDSRRWTYWLSAETETELRQSYIDLLDRLGSALPTGDLGTAEIARRVWEQLKVNQFEYLLVFDNAPEVDERGRDGPDALRSLFLPIDRNSWSRGRVLITSRSKLFSGATSIGDIVKVDVGPLSSDAAVQMLLKDDQDSSDSQAAAFRAAAAELVERLEFLPLAISSVSGLMHDQINFRLEDLHLAATDKVNEVMKQALDHARAQPGLGTILNVAAFVNPDAITLDLLGGDMAAVSRLCNMSLLRWVRDDVYSMHRLHQDILRRDHSPGAALDALERVLQGFDAGDSSTFALGKHMSVHVEAVVNYVRGKVVSEGEDEKLAKVMNIHGQVLRIDFRYQAAEDTFLEALEMMRHVYGADAKNTDLAYSFDRLSATRERDEYALANLGVLGKLQLGDRLATSSGSLRIHVAGRSQGLRRFLSGESADRNMEMIKGVVLRATQRLQSPLSEVRDSYRQACVTALSGLKLYLKTYRAAGKSNVANCIETCIADIESALGEDA